MMHDNTGPCLKCGAPTQHRLQICSRPQCVERPCKVCKVVFKPLDRTRTVCSTCTKKAKGRAKNWGD